jgi:hypothetical protein
MRRVVSIIAFVAAFVAALAVIAARLSAQSRPLVSPAAAPIYQRLLPQIERIPLFDHHAHPAFPDDADVDITPPPPGASPLRTFVLIHGGYPYDREAIFLTAMKNVYLTDAFPFGEALGVEEVYWLGVRSTRTALAAALAEMIAAREVTDARAIAFAHAYLHDAAAALYR